jgi:predicted dehydrogenase
MTITVGVAPTGVGSRLHQAVLVGLPNVRIRQLRLPRIKPGHFLVPSDWAAIAQELRDLDLFIVATPPHCQVQHAEYLLRTGIPVLIEKPAGMSASQAERLGSVADAIGIDCRVNYQLRFDPLVQRARDLVARSETASVQMTCTSSARRSRDGKPAWYWEPISGGGVWFSLLSHLVDLAHYLGLQLAEPRVMHVIPLSGPFRGIDALTVHAYSGHVSVTLTADAVAEETAFKLRVADHTTTTTFDLMNGEIVPHGGVAIVHDRRPHGPWHAAFDCCTRRVFSDEKIVLSGCGTLYDAVANHRIIAAVKQDLCSDPPL